MKIKTDFTTNSSSSVFLVLKTSQYYKAISKQKGFVLKDEDYIGRSTGCYEGENLLTFISDIGRYDLVRWGNETLVPLIDSYGIENVALVMISDEEDIGIPYPDKQDILFQAEYH